MRRSGSSVGPRTIGGSGSGFKRGPATANRQLPTGNWQLTEVEAEAEAATRAKPS